MTKRIVLSCITVFTILTLLQITQGQTIPTKCVISSSSMDLGTQRDIFRSPVGCDDSVKVTKALQFLESGSRNTLILDCRSVCEQVGVVSVPSGTHQGRNCVLDEEPTKDSLVSKNLKFNEVTSSDPGGDAFCEVLIDFSGTCFCIDPQG